MALFMDISTDDDKEVLSVVVGCTCSSGSRAIFIDVDEGKRWAENHRMNIHNNQLPKSIHQAGEALPRPKTRRGGLQTVIYEALLAHGTLGPIEIAELTGTKHQSIHTTLARLVLKGKASKKRVGPNVYYSAIPQA